MSNPANEPGGSTYNSQVPGQTPSDLLSFVRAVLAGGGWPDTISNEQFLLNLGGREGTVAAFNPFATKWKLPGSYDLPGNSPGDPNKVQQYATFADGVAATVKTLKQSNYYPHLQAALASGDAAGWDAQGKLAKDLSTWSGGGYTTVSNVNGQNHPLTSRGQSPTGGPGGGGAGTDTTGNFLGFLKAQAPQIEQALASDPRAQQIVAQWASGNLSDADFQNQFESTNWWKTTPQAQRQLLVSQATDPATAQQNLDNQAASINSLAAQLGVGLPAGVAQKLALDSINGQWSSQQIKEQLATYAQYQGNVTYKGEAAVDVNTLRGIYQDMALPVDNGTLNRQLQDLLGGKLTAQDVQQQLATQAATFYASNPQLAEFLKGGGGTTRQWATPLINKVANILGTDPNSIDLTNNQWSFLLQPQTNPTTGQSTGMAQTLSSVEQKVKTDPVFGYSKTPNGIADYQGLIDKLQTAFTGGGV